ncbi:DUF4238 domain-containing protein [Cerasicoccus frondis]|uniref:DUF4238 domain-containing protein n=1 Tax=Cerasicoccus frondis TaxID=490090 RepID=UPI002852D7D7|nr:DUF4238 domain-containing protein [Cerasicoccus frondis]
MPDPKKHHFLPQFYLRGFANDAKKLFMFEKKAGTKSIATCVENSGAKRDYHVLDFNGRERDRKSVELKLSAIEGRQAEMLKQLKAAPTHIDCWHEDLVFFTSLMYHRVPAYKSFIENQLREIANAGARMLFRAGELSEPPEEIKALIREKGDDIFDAKISNWKVIEQMLIQAESSPIIQLLSQMNFDLIVLKDEAYQFITSDTPVTLYSPNHDPKSPYGKGFSDPSIEVALPLSNRSLLLFRHSSERIPHITEDYVRHINQRVIVNSLRFIYTKHQSEELEADINRLASQKAGFFSSTLDFGEGTYFISKIVPVTNDHLNS